MAQGKALREIVSGSSPDGRKAYFEMVGVPIKDEHGRVAGGFEIIRDITELMAAINKLNQSTGSPQSGDMRAIQGEMNQPLSGISGYSELLKGSVGADDPAYRYATKIYEQSQRLTDMIRKINNTQTIQEDKEGRSKPK